MSESEDKNAIGSEIGNGNSIEYLNSRQILFLFDARDCNPNGERETGFQGPRIDSHSRRAIITDVSFKYMIRRHFLNKDKTQKNNILMRQSFKYKNGKEIPIKQNLMDIFDVSKKRLKNMSRKELIKLIETRFIDHRLFGSMFYVHRDLHATTGPVQFQNTLSLNIPRIIRIPITSTLASEAGKGAGSMGRYSIIDYAIFPVYGIIKKSLSKYSGAQEEDYPNLLNAMWNGIKSHNTRTKFQQLPRLLLSICPKDPRLQIPNIKNSIKLLDNNSSNFKECCFEIGGLIEIIQKYGDEIFKIGYKEDKEITYYYEGEEFSSIKNTKKFVKSSLELYQINL
ncbi:MAG: putative CRISPR-associated protein, Csh2 family [Promethearchaeota archaeon]|nr:MAG: putative CRISPR-associated protein, Csh2 family [Candidatus Lokiarchaeota archaeon]